MSCILFSAGAGTLLGTLYAVLFLVRNKTALFSHHNNTTNSRALVSLVISPVSRLALLGSAIVYLLLYTAINLILMVLFFLVIFWIIVINHERFM